MFRSEDHHQLTDNDLGSKSELMVLTAAIKLTACTQRESTQQIILDFAHARRVADRGVYVQWERT